MKVFFTIFKNDLKLFLKDKTAIILLLVVPVLFIGFFVTSLSSYLDKSNFIEPFDIALVDKENSSQTRIITRQLYEITVFNKIIDTNEPDAYTLIRENKVAAIIIIPENFSQGLIDGTRNPVEVVGNRSMPLQSFVVKTLVQSASNLFSSAQSALFAISKFENESGIRDNSSEVMMDLALKAIGRNEIYAETEDEFNFRLSPAEYFTAGLLVIFLMYGGIPSIKMLVAERNSGIMRRLLATPVRTRHIIASKVSVSIIISILQFGVIIVSTSLIFKNYWGGSWSNILLLFTAIIFAVSTWSVMIASFARKSSGVDVLANLGILIMAILGGSIYQISSMPDVVKMFSYLTINRWAMDGFMVIFSGNSELSVQKYVLALVVIGLIQGILAVVFLKINRRRI